MTSATVSDSKVVFARFSAEGVGALDVGTMDVALVNVESTLSIYKQLIGTAVADGQVVVALFSYEGGGVLDVGTMGFALGDGCPRLALVSGKGVYVTGSALAPTGL